MTTTSADTPNPFVVVIANDGDEHLPDLTEMWVELRGLLQDGTYTVDELMAATGIRRNTVKGFLFHGFKAGVVQRVDTTRRTEVGRDLWMVRTVRGFRLVQS